MKKGPIKSVQHIGRICSSVHSVDVTTQAPTHGKGMSQKKMLDSRSTVAGHVTISGGQSRLQLVEELQEEEEVEELELHLVVVALQQHLELLAWRVMEEML